MKKLASAFLLVLLAFAGLAATLPMTVPELAAQSQAVATAEIISLRGATMTTPAGNFSFILYRARTLSVLDGTVPAEFNVRVPGRVNGSQVTTLPDSPPLAVGLRLVLFLKPAAGTAPADAVYEIVGFSEGALPLIETPGREPLALLPAGSAAPSGRRARARLNDLGTTVKAVRANRGVKP